MIAENRLTTYQRRAANQQLLDKIVCYRSY